MGVASVCCLGHRAWKHIYNRGTFYVIVFSTSSSAVLLLTNRSNGETSFQGVCRRLLLWNPQHVSRVSHKSGASWSNDHQTSSNSYQETTSQNQRSKF